jgi:hypothetical protein
VNYSSMPLWLLATLIFAALIAARELGHWFRHRRRASSTAGDGAAEDGFAMTSMLGLLALLIAFSFSIGLQRYDTRRELVISEANAIGTTWLRTKLLDEADRTRLQSLLREYVDTRVEFGMAGTAEEELAAFRKTEAVQERLWNAISEVVAPFRTTPLAALLVTTTNESIDLAATRKATREAIIPSRILEILLLYALIAGVMIGYEKGSYRMATSLLFVLLTLAASVVLDLDRPATGAIRVSQQPMLDLQRAIADRPDQTDR